VSPTGRPEGERRSAKHEGFVSSPTGRPEGERRSAKHEGFVSSPTGRPEGEHRSAKHEGFVSATLNSNPDATLLAFDFGVRRIGVAIGTTRLRSARPLTTIESERNDRRFDAIAGLIAQWQPKALVVGLPLHADGTPHEMTARARRFARQLAGRFGLPVHEVDERYTSELARAELRASGRGRAAHRAEVDAVAAQLILQAWLDTPHDDPPAA
jgi:putative Holliday junction resolvase